ncbi:MAG: mechanosensitive ion channel domain-containing protein [Pseudomonadota bacterium]
METPANLEEARAALEPLIEMGIAFGLNALGALAVLILGLWIAGAVKKAVRKGIEKSPKIDETLGLFFASIAYYVILAIVVITALGVFGVPTTSFAAILGAAGLAVGLALQGTLGHIASGVMLLIFRPFKIGDFIEAAGEAGTVKAITLFTTELATPDNVHIIVPNGAVWGDSITNYSYHATRRVDLVFGISYEDDINKAMAAIRTVVEADPRAHKDPEPQIVVGELGGSSVDIITRVWTASGDYWGLKFDLLKAVKEKFDAENVNIPYPTQTVYEYQMKK